MAPGDLLLTLAVKYLLFRDSKYLVQQHRAIVLVRGGQKVCFFAVVHVSKSEELEKRFFGLLN